MQYSLFLAKYTSFTIGLFLLQSSSTYPGYAPQMHNFSSVYFPITIFG
jgi:hypothetical protein